ncbi:hypothetical protein [Fusobacterium sp. PH5-44]|uniref:hypothetical protein n=1 Tax=unclassified Fusobacterium TaxID=2648384 RepID=UPI003D1F1221
MSVYYKANKTLEEFIQDVKDFIRVIANYGESLDGEKIEYYTNGSVIFIINMNNRILKGASKLYQLVEGLFAEGEYENGEIKKIFLYKW